MELPDNVNCAELDPMIYQKQHMKYAKMLHEVTFLNYKDESTG